MPDAVAYIIYPSIIRNLTYPELEAYLEPYQISTMELSCENNYSF